ncbi:hypothetical protein GCM10017044_22880 [Kordiimonas sediminis]|uniref:Peptidase M28 domain-containing protein n=2 Tax=Kordiimonas sediminis TaxID=1735581 RepID=A0A919AX32_9PROT|nr:hypothetical protein GCM10017044_22880 [Kordiimonas sediminis]
MGSSAEEEAREALSAELAGEPGIFMTEEGFRAPVSSLQTSVILTFLQCIILLFAPAYPFLAAITSMMLFLSWMRSIDNQKAPFTWLLGRQFTANLTASKGKGSNLVLVISNLEPRRIQWHPHWLTRFTQHHMMMFIVLLGLMPSLVSWLLFMDVYIPAVLVWLLTAALLIVLGYTVYSVTVASSASKQADMSIAGAVAIVRRLWRDMPDDTEVRLLISTGRSSGFLGTQHYLDQHREEFEGRSVYVLNVDMLKGNSVAFSRTYGSLSPVHENGIMVQTASLLAGNKLFPKIQACTKLGYSFDSIWFTRAGMTSVTITSGYLNANAAPPSTSEEKLETVSILIEYGEAVVRSALTLQSAKERSHD